VDDDDEPLKQWFVDAQSRIKPDSGPGVMLSNLKGENAALFATYGEEIFLLFKARLVLRVKTSHQVFKAMPAQERVAYGYQGLLNIFVKDEPHTVEKIAQGRFRLIHGYDLVDSLIEMFLFDAQNKTEISHWTVIPSKPGIGFTQEMSRAVGNYVKDFTSPRSSDMRGWDWHVTVQDIEFDADIRVALTKDISEELENGYRNTLDVLAHGVCVFKDGTGFILHGRMKSGSHCTSSTNSRIRYAFALLAGARAAMTNGDDCVEDSLLDFEEAKEAYALLGKSLKQWCEPCDEYDFTFCSQNYKGLASIPIDPWRSLYRVATGRSGFDQIYSFTQLYSGLPVFERILAFFKQEGMVAPDGSLVLPA
jgi:hypothetical protein